MKLLVQSTGDFQLLAEDTNDLIRAHGASVVRPSPFVEENVASGRIEKLEEVGDEADNAAWDDTLKEAEGDFDLARGSFAKEFPVKKNEEEAGVQALPAAKVITGNANPANQRAGLDPNVKPGAPGTEHGPGGPRDTNVPKSHAQHKPGTPAANAASAKK